MKNSVSDRSFYIETEEEDEENEYSKCEDDGHDSDSSNYSNDNQQQSKPNSLNTTWPQSYRQSIDLYSSVPSPSLNFLGTPALSRLSGSFLSSSFTRRHTPEILPSLAKPLLQTLPDEQQPQQRRSSHSILPPISSRRSFLKKVTDDQKSSKVSHEISVSRQSSYGQAVLNGMNVLCGVGILSTPYAVKEGGWAGLSLLFIFGILSFYTGILLRYCLDSQPGLETYPDIGQATFGTMGRVAISIILYVELYACCVEYIILESDNLSSLFPNAHLSLAGFELNSPHLFALITTLAVLPTVWLRDLSVLSYISAGGVVASILVVLCLFWVGLVDDVGFQGKGTTLNLSTLPVALGLYGYCYSGHAVFPNIYTSMEKRNQFPLVLLTSFALCTLLYAGVAVIGYLMFGKSTQSQYTLNMPQDLVASKIAVWTMVVNPFTKYALTMSPVAMSLEELIPSSHLKSHMYSILIRTKGSRVEVSSDEEGFKGAWYIATILDPNPKKKPQKLYVEYQSLLDEDGSKPLREFVNLEFLRPIPLPEPEKTQCFQLNDVVDALYRDGWWTVVIIRVLDNSRFVVAFQNPPDPIEFGVSELRVHRDWVFRKWIQPEKKAMRTTGLMFSKGKKVEVSFEKEEYCDAWFSATVIEEVWNNSFLVEYQRRGANGGSELVKLIVDFLHIRPSPPHLKDKKIVLLEKVDAYIDFGWWSGVITKELADGRYVVFFKSANMEMEVNHSELRPHMKWKDGNWFSASQDVLTSSDYQGHVRNVSYNVDDTEMAASLGSSGTHEGNSEERPAGSIDLNLAMENQIEQSTPCNEKASNAMVSLEENTKLPTPDTDDRLSQPSKKLKESSATDSLSPSFQLNTTPMDTPSEDAYFGFATTTNEATRANSFEQPMVGDLPTIKADNFSRGKKARSKRHKPGELGNHTLDPLRGKAGRPPKSPMSSTQALARDEKPGEQDDHTPDPSRRKVGRPPKLRTSGTQPSAGVKKDDVAGFTKEKFVGKESVSNEIIVTLNLESEGMKNTQAKEPHHIPHEESLKVLDDQRKQLHDPAADRIKEGDQLGSGRESISRRKRGRPRKFPAKSPEASAAVNQQNGGVTAYDMLVKNCMENEVGSPTISGIEAIRVGGSVPVKEYMKPFGVDKKILNGSVVLKSKLSNTLNVPSAKKDQLQHRKVVQTSDKQHEKYSSKRGRRRTISVNSESPIQDPQDVSVGKMTEVYEKDSLAIEEMAIDQLPSNMSDDQPLSMWFEGMQSPKTADASSVCHGRNVEQCAEATRSQKDIFMQSPVFDDMGGIVPGENQSLPFVKNTPLWKTIESMEVFRKMPQKPHFRSLELSRENSREGLAIGFMVNFVSVAEKTSSLRFDDSRSIIEDNLETLVELENHGFDVKLLRDRLTGLLLMKDKQEELEDESSENRSQMRDINEDKSKIDEKIAEIDKKLCILQEERALALSTKEEKDSEIAYLESTVNRINNVMSSVRLQFEALVAAPW